MIEEQLTEYDRLILDGIEGFVKLVSKKVVFTHGFVRVKLEDVFSINDDLS